MKRVIFVITVVAMLSLPFANVVHSEEGVASKEMSTVHLNLKEAAELSPETDGTREAIEEKPPRSHSPGIIPLIGTRTRDWVTIGTWNSESVKYDTNLSGPVQFNMWWVEDDADDDYNARFQMRWTVETDSGEEVVFEDDDEYDCEQSRGNPCEWTGQVSNVSEANTTTLSEGSSISVTIEYQAFQDIYIYYDNATFDSGMAWDAEGIFVGGASNNNTEISIDLVQAWKTDLGMALDGGYIILTAGGQVINNTEATVGVGEEYEINGTAVASERITWIVESNEGASISFSYATNESAATPVTLTIASLPGGNPDEPAGEGGGIPGFSTVVAVVTISLVALRKRF